MTKNVQIDPQDEIRWWVQCPSYQKHHPLSISSTEGLFPLSWGEIIESRYQASHNAEYERERFDSPNKWLIIPEFGVDPKVVNYVGFDMPINWGYGVQDVDLERLVELARSAVSKEFTCMIELSEYAGRDPQFSSKKAFKKAAAAEVYDSVISNLVEYTDRRLSSDDRVSALAAAGSAVAVWIKAGPGAAWESMREGGRRGGEKGVKTRLANSTVDRTTVIRLAEQSGWPVKVHGVNKEISRRLGCTASWIGQILRSEKELRSKGG